MKTEKQIDRLADRRSKVGLRSGLLDPYLVKIANVRGVAFAGTARPYISNGVKKSVKPSRSRE